MDKSLVTGETRGRAKRYRMLETVRQYGWDKLNESGKSSDACNQHLNFFLALAQQTEPRLIGSAQEVALDELEAEHANLLAALTWAAEAEPVAALKLSNALGWFWEKRGSLAEGREWFRRTIARCPVAPADLCGEAHVRAGRIACWQGDYQHAVALTEQGLHLCEQSGNRRWAGMALNNLGGVAAYCGELTRAESLLERSLSIGKDLADNDIVWRSLGDLGVVAMFQGNYERARDLVEQTIVIGRLGDEDGGIMLHVLGDIECALGNIEKAASCYEQTLALGRKLGHKRAIAGALEGLGKVASDRGDYVRAREFYHEGLRVANEIGEKSEYAITIGINLAELAAEEQKSDEARSHSTTSLRSSRQVGDKESIASALSILGWLCFASDGQAEKATQLLSAAETARQSTGIALSPRQRARHERRLAVLRAALGQEGFAAAWARGKAMTLDQAIACVL